MDWYKCELKLNDETAGFFYTGEEVGGSVTLELKNDITLNYLYCDVRGKCKAHWSRPMPVAPYIRIYSEKRQVLYTRIDLQNNKDVISAGIHSLNFQFILPEDLPSSFNSSIAYVKYSIKLIGETKNKLKMKQVLNFTVFRKVDLKEMEQLLTPLVLDIQKKFWTSGDIQISILTYAGFSIEQNIPFEINIVNIKEKKISKIKIELIRKTEYNTKSGRTNDEKSITSVENKALTSSTKELCYLNLVVPRIAPSSINEMDAIINISYVLRVDISFIVHFSIIEDIPVTVASLPITQPPLQWP